jgi:pimeloyl-ACP methyl ester carboxylesterase
MSDSSNPTWPVLEQGHGRPIVFLHGYPLSHAMWKPQLGALSDFARVVLLDLPGYGLAQGSRVPDTLPGFAESVHQTLVRHGEGPVVLVGHSFGGYVALDLIAHHPELVAALVLTNTRSEPDTPEAREKRLATAHRLGEPGEQLDVEATTRALLAPSTWEAGGPLVDQIRGIVGGVRSSTIIPTLAAIAHRPDLTPNLTTIRVPTLVLWGEEDQLIPPAQSRSMVTHLQGATGAGIPRAGHLPSLEAPSAFTEALRHFLSSLPPLAPGAGTRR